MSHAREYLIVYEVHKPGIIEVHNVCLDNHTTQEMRQVVSQLKREGKVVKDVFIGQDCQECKECDECGGEGRVYKRRAKLT